MAFPSPSPRPQRPRSAVSSGVGMAGMVGMAVWLCIAIAYGMNGPYAALTNIAFCGVPMVLWSIFVDRVHRNPTTGIDWDQPPRSDRTITDVSLTKLAGLWATWAIIAGVYCIFRFYWRGNYLFAMEMFTVVAAPMMILSIPYVMWLDRRVIDPRDGAWHLGAWLMGQSGYDADAISAHLRSWAVKGFFLAFMLSIVPGSYADFVGYDVRAAMRDPVGIVKWLILLMFVIDIGFATVGYTLTMRPLDSHIRSATPYTAGWIAALMCYPPFVLMGNNAPLDYHPATAEWNVWLSEYPLVLAVYGAVLVGLTGIYAWATVAFGLRFSNLTDRGIITHGPFAWTKHPAYLSKNLFWWLSTLPFLVTNGSIVDAVRNTVILGVVSAIYYWRALTEELHLANDPAYGIYAAWMEQYGAITSRIARIWRPHKSAKSALPAE